MKQVFYTVNVGLKGITPLLMHKCGIIETNKKKSSETNYNEEWKKTIYTSRSDSKRLVIPSWNIEAMLRDASPGTKIGKQALSKIITPGTGIVEYESDLLYNNKPVTIIDIEKNNWLFTISVRVQKNRVARIRACFPVDDNGTWSVYFTTKVFNRLITEDVLRELFESAGDKEGLMDWRPGSDKPGKFGQFELVKFEVC